MKKPVITENVNRLIRNANSFLAKRRLVFTLLFLLIPALIFSQSRLSTKSKKASELYYQADNYWVRGQFTMAFDLLQDAVRKDADFYEAYFRLGVIEKSRGKTQSAEQFLLKTISIKGDHAGANFELGELYIQMGEYEKSIQYTQSYLDQNPRNAKRSSEAQKFLESAEYAIENINRAYEINPRVLPPNINQYAMQYFPVITADGSQLIYTRRLGTTMNHDEDLVISKKDSLGVWGEPISISDNINSSFNEGTCTISADGRMLIFTSCYGRNGFGSCDLYISEKTGNEWSRPKNLGQQVNSPAWDSQPSLSADGRSLYFISNRANGIGKRDIWVTRKDDSGSWGTPVNMGREINTIDDEVSPFIHPNDRTLYFGSNGRKGFGGFDIYYSEKSNDTWAEPDNLGYPINTGEDQVSLFITADGATGYYSHENLTNPNIKGEIYQFDVPEDLQVKYKAVYVEGKVYDEKTEQPLKAKIELFDLKRDERISMVYSDSLNGEYLMVLPEGTDYAFYVNKKGYLFKSLTFELENKKVEEPLSIDIPLKLIEKGNTAVLKNVFFDFDSYTLKEKSKTELQKVINFLIENKEVAIEIAGFTDNIGSEDYNLKLSTERANAVYTYLIDNGISSANIGYKGYGQAQPIASNDTEDGRQKNRRIEFIIQ